MTPVLKQKKERFLLMNDQQTVDALATGDLIVQVDDGRAVGDPFKLPADLKTTLTTRLAATKTANAASMTVASTVAGAAGLVVQGYDKLRELLRSGFNGIKAVTSDDATTAQKHAAFTAYGWEGDSIGVLAKDTRVKTLAEQAVAVAATPPAGIPAATLYPAMLVTRITNWLGIIAANKPGSEAGNSELAIKARNDSRDPLEKANSRVRFFYCSASDDLDQTKELANIGMQPRRDAGDAAVPPKPDGVGPVTFDAALRVLTATAMPAHATSLRAYRKPAGGTAVLAGVSTGLSVPVSSYAPLETDVAYDMWLVAHNAQGEGPASPHVTFTA
jgi:hypothetical protein